MSTLTHFYRKPLPSILYRLLSVCLLASTVPLSTRGQFLTEKFIEKMLEQKQMQNEVLNKNLETLFQLKIYNAKKTDGSFQFDKAKFQVRATAKPDSMHVYNNYRHIRTRFHSINSTAKITYTFSVRNIDQDTLHIGKILSTINRGVWVYNAPQDVPPGELLTFTVRNLSLNGQKQSTHAIYVQTNKGAFKFSIDLCSKGIKAYVPADNLIETIIMHVTPWTAEADVLENQTAAKQKKQQQQALQAKREKQIHARKLLDAALVDTVYPYTLRKFKNGRLNLCMNQHATANTKEDIDYKIAIEDTKGIST